MKREKELKIGINWGKKCNLKKKKKEIYETKKEIFSFKWVISSCNIPTTWHFLFSIQSEENSKKTNTVLFSSREYNYIKNTLQYSLRFIQVRNHWIKDLAMITIHVEILNNNIFNANSFRDRAW